MKILIDKNVPLALEIFNNIGKVSLIEDYKIENKVLKDFDVLIIRSTTKVDKNLLENTKIKFVGTATTGIDHIDIDYLNKNNIAFVDAAGCNSNSVVEYFFSILFNYCAEKEIEIKNIKLGVIGAGRIGGSIADKAEKMGIKVLRNDPPLAEKNKKIKFFSLDELSDCNFITIHTPLTKEGKYPTFHLLDEKRIKKFINNPVIINTARGAVIDNSSLLNSLLNEQIRDVILDVWENEPYINVSLLKKVWLGTPHIAGYSYEGKINGTIIIYNKLCQFLGINKKISIEQILPEENNYIKALNYGTIERNVSEVLKKVYNYNEDFKKMKEMIFVKDENKRAEIFYNLRKNYPVRREFRNYIIDAKRLDEKSIKILKILNFKIAL